MINTLTDKLIEYGLSRDEAVIYSYINKNNAISVLNISKGIHINRTKVYRLLDKLIHKGLIAQEMGERGFVYITQPLDCFQSLIVDKEIELKKLKEQLPILLNQLDRKSNKAQSDSKVLYYQGIDGLKQVTWNSLKADKKLKIMEVASDMAAFLDKEFSEQVRQEFVRRRIHVMQLTNISNFPAFTKITDFVKNYWEARYINPKDLNIEFESLIYNDVVALYGIKGKNIFCVEIYDKRLAKTYGDLFNFIWKNAKKMRKINEYGASALR